MGLERKARLLFTVKLMIDPTEQLTNRGPYSITRALSTIKFPAAL